MLQLARNKFLCRGSGVSKNSKSPNFEDDSSAENAELYIINNHVFYSTFTYATGVLLLGFPEELGLRSYPLMEENWQSSFPEVASLTTHFKTFHLYGRPSERAETS